MLVALLAAGPAAGNRAKRAAFELQRPPGTAADAAWQPSLQQETRGVERDDRDWFASMARELRRSLNDTRFSKRSKPKNRENAMKLLRRVVTKEKLRDGMILVLGGRIYTTQTFLHADKARKYLLLLAAIQRRFGRLPNVWMLHETSSVGTCHSDKRFPPLPTTVIAKREGYKDCGLLVPNPYFGRGDVGTSWASTVADLQTASSLVKERIPRVFWRGAVDQHVAVAHIDGSAKEYPCHREKGNYARLQSLALTAEHPQLFDSKCNTVCAPRDAVQHPCVDLPYDATMTALQKNITSARDADFYRDRDYANYKYVLNLPGKTDGSYSRNLNHLWAVGAAVLLWDSPVVEWFYPALKHGETHASVGRLNAKAVVDDLQTHKDKYKALVKGAQRVQNELMSPEGIDKYMRIVVEELRAAQSQQFLLDTAEDVRNVFEGLDCSDLKLVETFVTSEHGAGGRFVEIGHRRVTDCQKFVDVTRFGQSANDAEWLAEIKRDLLHVRDLRFNLTHQQPVNLEARLSDLDAEHAAHRAKIRAACAACQGTPCSARTLDFCQKSSRGQIPKAPRTSLTTRRVAGATEHAKRRLADAGPGGRGTYAVARMTAVRRKHYWMRVGMACLDILGLVIAGAVVGGLLWVFRELHGTFAAVSRRRKRANSVDKYCY